MKKYQVESTEGDIFGVWRAQSPVHALAMQHRDAGVACIVRDGEILFEDPDQEATAGNVEDWIIHEVDRFEEQL